MSRRIDIDWLRILATLLLFVFHVGKAYDVPPFYQVKAPDPSPWLSHLTGFIHIWHMPLFFAVAGWSVYASLMRRGAGMFVRERVRRLLIPFLIGCVMICPAMQYVYAINQRGYTGTFGEFIPLFFTSLTWFSWSHLWFLIYLFTFTLLYLPLFKYLAARSPSQHVAAWRLWIPLPILVAIQVVLRPLWPGFQNLFDDWANFTYYSTFFTMGFVLAWHPTVEASVQARWKTFLLIAVVSTLLFPPLEGWLVWGMPHRVLFAVASYHWVLALWGIAHRGFKWSGRNRRYLSEAAYPLYFLHQAFIIIPGYWIVQQPWPLVLRFGVSLAVAVTASFAVYHGLIRPFNSLRALFGMKPKRG